MQALDAALGQFPLIINTVPAMLLDADRLRLLKPKALVLDLASKPGGDDAGAGDHGYDRTVPHETVYYIIE